MSSDPSSFVPPFFVTLIITACFGDDSSFSHNYSKKHSETDDFVLSEYLFYTSAFSLEALTAAFLYFRKKKNETINVSPSV
ncbi:MAG: hypothetical protein E6540_11485, partial [Enterococcus sp.]|nr:hypothetical protein [Enterococcus sp.]